MRKNYQCVNGRGRRGEKGSTMKEKEKVYELAVENKRLKVLSSERDLTERYFNQETFRNGRGPVIFFLNQNLPAPHPLMIL
jgi:hypothetical protein